MSSILTPEAGTATGRARSGAAPINAAELAPKAVELLKAAVAKHVTSDGARPGMLATASNRASRSKRKVIYTIVGPLAVAGVAAATGGAALVAAAAAVGGIAAKKGWRNLRAVISDSRGKQKFLAALRAAGAKPPGEVFIDNAVLQHTRFYLQKRDLSKLCDEFIRLHEAVAYYKEVSAISSPPRSCADAEKLVYAGMTVAKRKEALKEDFDTFAKLYGWMTNSISAWSDYLGDRFLEDAKAAIREQVNTPLMTHRRSNDGDYCCCAYSMNEYDNSLKTISTPTALRTQDSICYRHMSSTAIRSPKLSNTRSYAWKFIPEARLWTDAANEAFGGRTTSIFTYDPQLVERAEERVGSVGRPGPNLPPVAVPAPGFSGVQQGLTNMGRNAVTSTAISGTNLAVRETLIAAGANIGSTVTAAAINGAISGGASIGASAVQAVGEAWNLSNELRNLSTTQTPTELIRSLRSVLKSKYFESSMDLFCKVNSRMRDIRKIEVHRAQNAGQLTSCVYAYNLAYNILSAKKNMASYAATSRHMGKFYAALTSLLTEADRVESELEDVEGQATDYFRRHPGVACEGACYMVVQEEG